MPEYDDIELSTAEICSRPAHLLILNKRRAIRAIGEQPEPGRSAAF